MVTPLSSMKCKMTKSKSKKGKDTGHHMSTIIKIDLL